MDTVIQLRNGEINMLKDINKIKNVAVIGGGLIGAGWAARFPGTA
jgi:hypothetical protein